MFFCSPGEGAVREFVEYSVSLLAYAAPLMKGPAAAFPRTQFNSLVLAVENNDNVATCWYWFFLEVLPVNSTITVHICVID